MSITDFEFPPMSILNVRSREVRQVSHEAGRTAISQGDWIETVPADEKRAREWHDDLLERVMRQAKEAKYDLAPFEEFEQWCAERDFRVLPTQECHLVLFLLHRARDGEQTHNLRNAQRTISAVHALCRHPPAHLVKTSWDAYTRAISFAKAVLRDDVRLLDLDRATPAKAIEMFPDGNVPLRWTDVAV